VQDLGGNRPAQDLGVEVVPGVVAGGAGGDQDLGPRLGQAGAVVLGHLPQPGFHTRAIDRVAAAPFVPAQDHIVHPGLAQDLDKALGMP
jgi:hypothetical protein